MKVPLSGCGCNQHMISITTEVGANVAECTATIIYRALQVGGGTPY